MTRGKVYPLEIISSLPKATPSKQYRLLKPISACFTLCQQKSALFFSPCFSLLREKSWNSESTFLLFWHLSVALAWLYNIWVLPLRWAFQLDNSQPWIYTNPKLWCPLDYTFDLFYVIDTVYVSPR